jgi:Family of unknown function (DUF6644)
MSLFKLLDWWGETPVAHAMNSAVWAFPAVEVLHMMGVVLLVGLSAIIDLRLLGFRLTGSPVSAISKELAPWTTAGFVTVLITGPLLLSTDPDRYYLSWEFRFKMTALALAILFDFFVHRKVRMGAGSPARQRTAAWISLVLWSCVVIGGRAIGVLRTSIYFA